jgi:hypothetical protein
MSKAACKINYECYKAETAGRAAYLANRCDYVMPRSIRRGSGNAVKGHVTELNEKKAAMDKCKACS